MSTARLLLELQDAGADLIEVGIPFSDPLADGPIIQAASARALAHGATPGAILRAVSSVRPRLRVPLVYLTYWNPVLQFDKTAGRKDPAPFVRAARDSGCAGLIVPDLSIEDSARLRQASAQARLASIFLAAPTSPPDRLRAIARASSGFIYYVSVTGTTGVRRRLPPDVLHGVRQLKRLTTKPVCVGFGISTPAHAAMVGRVADGVIVGSALIQVMARAKTAAQGVRQGAAFVRRLRRAL